MAVILASGFLGLGTTPSPVSAATCDAIARFWPDADYHGNGGIPLTVCNGWPALGNLANISGPCNGSWNDCISSSTNTLPWPYKVCVYKNSSYSGYDKIWILNSNHPNYFWDVWDGTNESMNDKVSSIKIIWGAGANC
jgi:hypothetical protein